MHFYNTLPQLEDVYTKNEQNIKMQFREIVQEPPWIEGSTQGPVWHRLTREQTQEQMWHLMAS